MEQIKRQIEAVLEELGKKQLEELLRYAMMLLRCK